MLALFFLPEGKFYNSCENKNIQIDDILYNKSDKWEQNLISFKEALDELMNDLSANTYGFELKDKYKSKGSNRFNKTLTILHNDLKAANEKYTIRDIIKGLRKICYNDIIKGGSKDNRTINQVILKIIDDYRHEYGYDPDIFYINDELKRIAANEQISLKFMDNSNAIKLIKILLGIDNKQFKDSSENEEVITSKYKISDDLISIFCKLASRYNGDHSNDISRINSLSESRKKDIINSVLNIYGKSTIGELLHASADFIKDSRKFDDKQIIKVEKFFYKLPALRSSREWLTNITIDSILFRFSIQYPHYYPLKTSPQNYMDCPNDSLNNFSLRDTIKKNISIIGVVFNTAYYGESGKHWVTVVINMKARPNRILYFDSNGLNACENILNWCKKQYKEMLAISAELNIEAPIFITNNISHQKSNTECGVYCIAVHLTELSENSNQLDIWLGSRISDSIIYKLRDNLFMDYNKKYK